MAPGSARDAAHRVSRLAHGNRALQIAARAGSAVNGVLHGIIGVIAIGIAIGAGDHEADQSGALNALSDTPGGTIGLWLIVVGLGALGLWQIIEGVLVPAPDPARKWAKRAADFGKAVVYLAVAISALSFAVGQSASSSKTSKDLSATLLGVAGGVYVLVAVGLAVFAVGAFFCFRGASRGFTRDIAIPTGNSAVLVIVLGMVGYISKGILLCVVGVLFVVAALTFDPDHARGLDSALKSLVALPFGAVILAAAGVGLIAYGLYCIARGKLARL